MSNLHSPNLTTRRTVLLAALAIIVVQYICIVVRTEALWPFSNMPMFASIQPTHQLNNTVLMGVTSEGDEINLVASGSISRAVQRTVAINVMRLSQRGPKQREAGIAELANYLAKECQRNQPTQDAFAAIRVYRYAYRIKRRGTEPGSRLTNRKLLFQEQLR